MRNAPSTVFPQVNGLTFLPDTAYKVWGSWGGVSWTAGQDATTASVASALGTGAHSNVTKICNPPTSGSYLCSRVVADPSPTRCR